MTRPLICGFIKAKDETLREGNIRRAIAHLRTFCDDIVACDDASVDGTREYLQREIPADHLLLVPPEKQDFRAELHWKQKMLEMVHPLRPVWIWWHDADEELEPDGVKGIRTLCQQQINSSVQGYRFHYTQYWRNKLWARTDDGFDDGWFLKLWRWSPGLRFNETYGTHHQQFPEQFNSFGDRIVNAPWDVLHWGNWGTNLRWKCIQYYGGLGGVERHLSFEKASYRPLIDGVTPRPSATPSSAPSIAPPSAATQAPKPVPFTDREKDIIRSLRNLKNLEATFTVVIPTFNRGAFLPTTLQSLLDQTYERWIAVVLDDGSTDNTPEVMRTWQDKDPRFFYGRYDKLGAVAMNELGMNMASTWSQWWTRLGSDDYFEPHKLMLDAMALERHGLCYGPYRDLLLGDDGVWATHGMNNNPGDSITMAKTLTGGNFVISWANIAARTDVLRAVKKAYGTFCDPRLRNMEDFLVNSRMVRFAKPVWRGAVETFHDNQSSVIINPGPQLASWLHANPSIIKHDAIWRVNRIGASADGVTTKADDDLTRALIAEETASWREPEPESEPEEMIDHA